MMATMIMMMTMVFQDGHDGDVSYKENYYDD